MLRFVIEAFHRKMVVKGKISEFCSQNKVFWFSLGLSIV